MHGKLLCRVTTGALLSSVDATNAREEAVRLTDIQLDKQSIEDGPSASARLTWVASPPLTAGPALAVVMLLSLGLWAVIWLAVSSLALAWPL
jgi:hypothetical protein